MGPPQEAVHRRIAASVIPRHEESRVFSQNPAFTEIVAQARITPSLVAAIKMVVAAGQARRWPPRPRLPESLR